LFDNQIQKYKKLAESGDPIDVNRYETAKEI